MFYELLTVPLLDGALDCIRFRVTVLGFGG